MSLKGELETNNYGLDFQSSQKKRTPEAIENHILTTPLSFSVPHKDHLIVYSRLLITQFAVVFIVLFCFSRESILGPILQKILWEV